MSRRVWNQIKLRCDYNFYSTSMKYECLRIYKRSIKREKKSELSEIFSIHTTLSRLSRNCLATVNRLSRDSLVTVSRLPATVKRLSHDCLTTASGLSCDCLKTVSWLSHNCCMTVALLPQDCLVTVSQQVKTKKTRSRQAPRCQKWINPNFANTPWPRDHHLSHYHHQWVER